MNRCPVVTRRPDVGAAPPAPRAYRLTVYCGIVCTAALLGVGGWRRRWIADDGLTVLRTVDNLLAGHGPVFNAGERVEVNTSTAWTYLIWIVARVTSARLEYVALGIAMTLSIAALGLAVLGAARLWEGGARAVVPAGAFVYVAVPPARDYVTSGLESGLVICWLALLWWSLVRWARAETVGRGQLVGLCFLAGLAPLIRPELTLVGAVALLVVCCSPLSGTRRDILLSRVSMVVAAGLVPVTYQVWRMGYYGLPYPNTAVAKDASAAKWRQGTVYLWDLVGPYALWVPMSVLGAAGLVAAVRRRSTGADACCTGEVTPRRRVDAHRVRASLRSPGAAVAVMITGGVLLTLYEIRVGGDFMHGRMLLPPLFCLLCPVMVLPLQSPDASGTSRPRVGAAPVTVLAVVVVMGWAWSVADHVAVGSGSAVAASGIADERLYYIRATGHRHPIRAEDYLDHPRVRDLLETIADTPEGGLVINTPSYRAWSVVPPADDRDGHTVYFVNLGMTGMNLPLDVRVIDPMGLAYPLAAHTFRFPDARIGHDKNLDADWAVVDTGMVTEHPRMPWFLDEGWVSRARTALACPATRDLLASSRAPLTPDRFRRNLTHALRYATHRIDRVPEFEIERC